jgi:hypothetical protein
MTDVDLDEIRDRYGMDGLIKVRAYTTPRRGVRRVMVGDRADPCAA